MSLIESQVAVGAVWLSYLRKGRDMKKTIAIAICLMLFWSTSAFGGAISRGGMSEGILEPFNLSREDREGEWWEGYWVPTLNVNHRIEKEWGYGNSYTYSITEVEKRDAFSAGWVDTGALANWGPDGPAKEYSISKAFSYSEVDYWASNPGVTSSASSTGGLAINFSGYADLITHYEGEKASWLGEAEFSMYTKGTNAQNTSASWNKFLSVLDGEELHQRFSSEIILSLDNLIVDDPVYFNFNFKSTSKACSPIPETSAIFLLGIGLIGVAGLGRRKFKKN
jgi:hypothetical protein